MHFHQQIHSYLLNYREKNNSNFNFLVRQKSNSKDKEYPGGKISHGLFFHGTEKYCSVGLIDKDAGNTSTRSVGLVFKPFDENYKLTFNIIFIKEKDEELISSYKKLASKFKGIQWDDKGTKAVLDVFEFPKDDPSKLYEWLDDNYSDIRNQALETDIKKLIPNDKRFEKLQNNLDKKFKQKATAVNYWVFQGTPNKFDFETAIEEGVLDNFTVSSHKDKINVGDKVIIWLTGENSGCYALAEVTIAPHKTEPSKDDIHWKTDKSNKIAAGIKITHNLYQNPILWKDINNQEAFKNLNVGYQGTNFSATKSEFNAILNMVDQYTWVETHKAIVQFLKTKKDKQGDLIALLKSVGITNFNDKNENGEEIKLEEIDPFTFFAYIYKYGTKKGLKLLKKIAKEIDVFQPNDEKGIPSSNAQKVWFFPYQSDRKRNEVSKLWEFFFSALNHTVTDELFKEVLTIKNVDSTKITEGLFCILPDQYLPINSPVVTFLEQKFDIRTQFKTFSEYKLILKQLREKTRKPFYQLSYEASWHWNNQFQSAVVKDPINKILFGPPGTGKTFKLQSEYFKRFTKYENKVSKEDYLLNEMEQLAWWQVLFIALLDEGKVDVKEILTHPTVKAKVKSTGIKNLSASIWASLQRHTKDECENVNVKSRAAIKPFWKTKDSLWHLYDQDEVDLFPEGKEILNKYHNYKNTSGQKIKNYSFVTFHQSFTYEDFVEGIKPVLDDDSDDVRYEISDGVFKTLSTKAHNDPNNNYAIFIDEINRGNVASIFGELITLIEQDKRKGAENELSVVLPYSKTQFSVPPNLHIIGTMNTADRSIEALDSALRRRFEFEEMLPQYPLIDEELDDLEFEGFRLSEILKTINERIIILIDRDHQIGHSYFLKLKGTDHLEKDLKQVFMNKFMPLLQEYFFSDYIKIAMVLGEGFMERDKYLNVKFATNAGDYESDYDDIVTYEIKKDVNLSDAIKRLMRVEENA